MVVGNGLATLEVTMWRRLLWRRLNQTTVLMLGCAAFLLGLVVARRHICVSGWMVLPFVAAAAVTLKRRTVAVAAIAILAGLLLGIWRGSAYLHALQPYRQLQKQKVSFVATADGDAVYNDKKQLAFTVRDVDFVRPIHVHVPGSVKISGYGETMVFRGDRLEIEGQLYPTRGASQATVSFAKLHKIGGSSSPIDTLRRKFAAGLQSVLPEPLASFGLGLLVGQRNTLPAEVTEAILMVGLTHIIAVSGYNLTILLEASRRLLGRSSKLLATVVAVVLIFGFLLIAGTSASIVRAAVISLIGLSAWYYGRSVRPLLLILLAAAGTTYANPVYLWADISWYLSFLAFFGILVLGPMVTTKLYAAKEPPMLMQIVIESLCAEVMTLPLILYIFGQMSMVSLLANMLVVALIPLAMLLSFIAGLAGMLIGNVAGWFAWPAQLLLTYMLDIVNLLSRIPHVFQENRYLSVIDMTVWYVVVTGVIVLAYYLKQRRQKLDGVSVRDPVIGTWN